MFNQDGDTFVHIEDLGALGIKDPKIPALASEHGCDCLITANVRDFGAKKFLFEELLGSGVHVAVLRPGPGKFNGPIQTSLLMRNYEAIKSKTRKAPLPILMTVSPSGVRERTLDELVAEFDAGKRLP